MQDFASRLKESTPLVADGAMGTMLFERGLEPGAAPESVNLERPDVLKEIATLYLEAGAAIIQTNTFGASPMKLAEYGLESKTEAINANALLAVREVVKGRAFVSASVGPSGRLLKPYGDTEADDVFRNFKTQMEALGKEAPDVICIETMTDIEEIKLAVRAAKETLPDIPVMATMTFDETSRGFFTTMGVNIEKAARTLEKEGVSATGSNCGNGIENMITICGEFHRYTRIPIIIQSNAGLPVSEKGKLVYPETPESMAEKAVELVKAGARIIGGCCGTGPEHIRAIKSLL